MDSQDHIARQLLESIRRQLVDEIDFHPVLSTKPIDVDTLAALIADVLGATFSAPIPVLTISTALARMVADDPTVIVQDAPILEELSVAADGSVEITASVDGTKQRWRLSPTVRAGMTAIVLGVASSAVYDTCKIFMAGNTGGGGSVPPPNEQSIDIFIVITDGLRVRKGPSFDAPVIGHLSSGTHVVCFSSSGEWNLVTLVDPQDDSKSETGWVHQSFLQAVLQVIL